MHSGKFDDRSRLTVVRRLSGQESIGPSGVWDQSFERMSLPISPPPMSQSDPGRGASAIRSLVMGVYPRHSGVQFEHARPLKLSLHVAHEARFSRLYNRNVNRRLTKDQSRTRLLSCSRE